MTSLGQTSQKGKDIANHSGSIIVEGPIKMRRKQTMGLGAIYTNFRRIWIFLLGVVTLFMYNEFLVYYLVLLQCHWPQLDLENADFSIPNSHQEPVRAMVLADTHLLGSREGHWFDKLRREWQMERAFQTSMAIHSPEVVFVIGDLLDEGKWCSDVEFHDTVMRFQQMFRHSDHTKLQVLVGNHDIGFHYMIDKFKRKRFTSAFNAPSVRMLNIRGINFVLLNSMAMEGDRCSMCHKAEEKLSQISHSLKCSQGSLSPEACMGEETLEYSRPVLLQHFPMYRISDSNCTGPDSAPPNEKYVKFKEKYDCISKESTEKLFQWIQPRLIITGHTHHGCFRVHPDGTPEWTIPSFNWRNKNEPSFLLITVSRNNYGISKCYMPQESTVLNTYIAGSILLLIWLLFPRKLIYNSRSIKTH